MKNTLSFVAAFALATSVMAGGDDRDLGFSQASASNHYPTNTWISPINGMSSIWELHMLRNVVRPVHTVYRCNALQECWKEFEKVRYLSNNFEYVEKVWMERLDGRINIIK